MEPDDSTPPTLTTLVSTVKAWSFSASATNRLHGSVILPLDYADWKDAAIHPFFVWAPDGTNTGDSKWTLTVNTAQTDDDSTPAEGAAGVSVYNALEAGPGTAYLWQHYENASSPITVTSSHQSKIRSSAVLSFTLARLGADAADTLSDAAVVAGVGFAYASTGVGNVKRWP
jgi:hypothetical protein